MFDFYKKSLTKKKQTSSIGVEDYLLKSITKKALIERLSEIRSRDFFEALVRGSMDTMEVYKKAEKIGMDIVAEAYNILICTMNCEEDFSGQKEEYSEWEAESLLLLEGFFAGNPSATLFRSNAFSYRVSLQCRQRKTCSIR